MVRKTRDLDEGRVVQIGLQSGDARVAIRRVTAQRPQDDLFHLWGDGRIERSRRLGIADLARTSDCEWIVSFEGRMPRQHLVEHGTQGINVDARASASPTN